MWTSIALHSRWWPMGSWNKTVWELGAQSAEYPGSSSYTHGIPTIWTPSHQFVPSSSSFLIWYLVSWIAIITITISSLSSVNANFKYRTMLSAILCGQQLTPYQEGGERRWLKKQESFSKFSGVAVWSAIHGERGWGAERGGNPLADSEQPGALTHRPSHDDDSRLWGSLRPGLRRTWLCWSLPAPLIEVRHWMFW